MSDASVAVVVVNWNHGRFLKGCLDALMAQDHVLDVMVVDNGSTDGSPGWVADHYPAVRLLTFSDNQGFSRAFNCGVRCANAPFLLSLNPDVTVKPGFISEMVRAAERGGRIGMIAPKLLRADNPTILDSTGLFIDRRRRPYDRGQGETDEGQYDTQIDVFGACGAAALYRRTMLEDLAPDGEYFDEGFFAYYEDADLSWRAQSRGWHCVYAPRAVATHARGWGDTMRKKGRAAKDNRGPRLALRNRYLMTLKNDASGHFVADLPRVLAAELPRLFYAALTMPEILLGVLDLASAWSKMLPKRRYVRGRRTVDDAIVRRWFVAPANTGLRYRE
jgi:GT2 family glycosyltransferase